MIRIEIVNMMRLLMSVSIMIRHSLGILWYINLVKNIGKRLARESGSFFIEKKIIFVIKTEDLILEKIDENIEMN